MVDALLIVLIISSYLLCIYYDNKKRFTGVLDNFIYGLSYIVTLLLIHNGHVKLVIMATSIVAILLGLTALCMIIFKIIPFVFKLVKMDKVDTMSTAYNADIAEFVIRSLSYVIIAFVLSYYA